MFKLPHRTSATTRTVEPALRSAFSDQEISTMARLGSLVHVSCGDDLITQGTEGTHAYFIVNGTAAVVRDSEVVAMLSRGDMVGEHALVTGELRNATVSVRMPVTALRFDREQFAQVRRELAAVEALSAELVMARK